MAYVRKLKNGKYRAEVERHYLNPPRQTKVFDTSAQAWAWANLVEQNDPTVARNDKALTVAQAFKRYEQRVSAEKAGARWESLRLALILRMLGKRAEVDMRQFTKADAADWRDARLKTVSASSVRREVNLLRNLWTTAVREWECAVENPFAKLRLPKAAPPRKRLISRYEIRAMLRSLGWVYGRPPTTLTEEVAWAFLVALHTSLRVKEVLGLHADDVNLRGRFVTLGRRGRTKTLEQGEVRDVPFTPRAAHVFAVLLRGKAPADRLFSVSPGTLDTTFRKHRSRLRLSGFTFHDSRATCLTRLARRYDVMTLARISQHADIKILYEAYYRETAESVAARL